MKNQSYKKIQDRFIDELLREQSYKSGESLNDEVKGSIIHMRPVNRLKKFNIKFQAAAAMIIFGTALALYVTKEEQNEITQKKQKSNHLVTENKTVNYTRVTPQVQAENRVNFNEYNAGNINFHRQNEYYPSDITRVSLEQNTQVNLGNVALVNTSTSFTNKKNTPWAKPRIMQPGENYYSTDDNSWKKTHLNAMSTFSVDVDNASYSNIRRMIQSGEHIPRDAVRIEECVNAFDYDYQEPKGDAAFAVGASFAACPWSPVNSLVRIAIKGKHIEAINRPASNLVFLIDVSGSMDNPNKLPLVRNSMNTLIEQLDERDHVGIVVYAGSEGVILPSTRMDSKGRDTALGALANLEAGGSTNGGVGIARAYELAKEQFISGGTNRVILATDGDFNVGLTNEKELVELVKSKAQDGIYLTVLGYGTGNLNDSMMNAISRDGNGNYYYIDSPKESDRVFKTNLAGTLMTIAKDVKIQVEFNPRKVEEYRLLGYSNRILENEDFSNDKVDAGDIGSGHTVTAFYEIVPRKMENEDDGLKYQNPKDDSSLSDEWMNIKLRHKSPEGNISRLTEFTLKGYPTEFDKADKDFRFASAVVMFGMKLREIPEINHIGWDKVQSIAEYSLDDRSPDNRKEFVELVKNLQNVRQIYETSTSIWTDNQKVIPEPAEVDPKNSK